MDAIRTSSGGKQTVSHTLLPAEMVSASMPRCTQWFSKGKSHQLGVHGSTAHGWAQPASGTRTRIFSLCRFSKPAFSHGLSAVSSPSLQTLPARLVEFFNSRRKQEMIQPRSGVSVSRARRDPRGCTGLQALGKGAASLRQKGTSLASPIWA